MKNKLIIIFLSILLEGCAGYSNGVFHFDVYDLPFPKTIGDLNIQTSTISERKCQ